MKKEVSKREQMVEPDMLPEYDFKNMKGGVRGRYYKANRRSYKVTIHKSDGTTVVRRIAPTKDAVFLDPDVRKYFPDSESVNSALRGLIALLPRQRRTKAK